MTKEELRILKQDPRRAIREGEIICLECGKSFKQLTNTHLEQHGLTAGEYKEKCGYNRRTALMSKDLRQLYSKRALKEGGLVDHWRETGHLLDQEARQRGGKFARRKEVRLTSSESVKRAAVKREHSYQTHPNLLIDITQEKIIVLWDNSQTFKKNCKRIAKLLGCGANTVRRRLLGPDYQRKT